MCQEKRKASSIRLTGSVQVSKHPRFGVVYKKRFALYTSRSHSGVTSITGGAGNPGLP